ncbi:MAG: helix-turn-helix transcriptional regulator, partial [Actinobacteria bacterium]|nr:helix-turn-helix transcriptional regulator [Actinomycetota bacterium]
AHTCFSALGASADADDARRALGVAGVVSPRQSGARTGRRGYGEHLSPREEQVAELAGQGLTNAQIATELHISARTVEVHMAAVLRKLGVSSKRDLLTRRRLKASR